MSSILQAQQLYTAGIPLLEAYLLPMANNRTHNERLSAASHVVQIHTHARFPRSKKWPTYHVAVCRTNRKRSSFATKHFQRKSLKIFDLHPPPRRLVSFVARINMWKVRCWVTDTHTHTHTQTDTQTDMQTHRPSTVTLAAHAHRGLFTGPINCHHQLTVHVSFILTHCTQKFVC